MRGERERKKKTFKRDPDPDPDLVGRTLAAPSICILDDGLSLRDSVRTR